METKKLLVIKIGTNVITDNRGRLDSQIIKNIIEQIVALKRQHMDVILITSGAVAAGKNLALLTTRPDTVTKRQVFAAIGQVALMSTYESMLKIYGLHAAQVLATKEDFRDRAHYRNMQRCLSALLDNDVVPIFNENDVVATSELMFTDNDELAEMVAAMLNAEQLFLLTSVDGVLDKDGHTISILPTHDLATVHIRQEKSVFGRVCMDTKCLTARRTAHLGITTYIINGKQPNSVIEALAKKPHGTVFLPDKKLPAVKKWLAQSRGVERGAIVITAPAEKILRDPKRTVSVLPIGITALHGEFKKGDIVQIKNVGNTIIGYGRTEYSSAELVARLGQKNQKECIHYDYLYLEL